MAIETHTRATMALEALNVADYNPRRISKEALHGLTNSVKRFGLVQDIVVNQRTEAKGWPAGSVPTMVGGHQRKRVLEEMGEKSAPVVLVDLDAAEEKALNVALNSPFISGEFVHEDLAAVIADVKAEYEDLAGALRFHAFDALKPNEPPNIEPKPVGRPRLETTGKWSLIVDDMRDALATMEPDSVDVVVTDPPYELGFMGKAWDKSGVAFDPETWRAVLRVLKPGGHLIAFGGTRTVHRIAVAIEDAGFEIRDQLAWMYGQGFPKSLDVSKAIDFGEAFNGAEIVGVRGAAAGLPGKRMSRVDDLERAPNSDAAREWAGWGTALKPAMEPAVLARKPLEGTVAHNMTTHGTGAINVDGCRIGSGTVVSENRAMAAPNTGRVDMGTKVGRWPANVFLDEDAAAMLDARADDDLSRFFYVAKPSRGERDAGLDDLPVSTGGEACDQPEDAAGLNSPRAGAGRLGGSRNVHATVKPIDLMRYLVRLVTPPGGLVLDPFTGSGTTGIAAVLEGFDFVGVEMETPHAYIAWHRISWWEQNPPDTER